MAEETALGKRKQRDDASASAHSKSTLFVSNLPYTATSTDLQTLFSDLGPVRSAFVVLEDGVSKGVGYVSFAISEDANSAMETIEKDGISLDGRKLRVQRADRKSREKQEKDVSKPKNPAKPRPTVLKSEKDPNAIRTVMISGLPSPIDQKTLWKKVRKYEGAESVELVEGETGIARALFSSPATAMRAVEKLHAHVFKGALLSVTLKKRLETLSKMPAKTDGSHSTAKPSRGSRLIVRNVPWNITEKDLRALFLPFGPVHSINIPTEKLPEGESESRKPRLRGFAFVWFYSKKDAERAIEGVNGRAVVAGAIVAPTMNKKERARLRRQAKLKAQEGQKKAEGEEEENKGEGEDENGKDVEMEEAESGQVEEEENASGPSNPEARILAVDWALSKEKWEEAKSSALANQEAESIDDGDDDDSDWVSEGEGDSEVGSENSGSGSEMDVDEDEDSRSDADEAQRPKLPQTDVGTTLFIRNVPFDATEEELRVLFRAFGPLRYARITVDAGTGRSRGTGFACFWNKDDADKAIHQSELLNRETGVDAPKKNPFSLPSLLTPDPSSSLAQSLVLHGRTLLVSRAVTRDDAARLKDEGERAREKADKRNTYLLREGVIFPGMPAAESLSPAELEKRTASYNTRRALLKSNPALFVSKTRLSIRGLPLYVSERALKRLGIYAVRNFEAEVKKGGRQALSPEELFVDTDDVDKVNEEEKVKAKAKSKKEKGGRDTGVKQAKIVRQNDRVDALTGKGKSRGYGFLEMQRHSDALRVLRWANNNSEVGGLFRNWWKSEVEELIKSVEKGDKKNDTDEALLNRLKSELEHLESAEGRKDKKTLVIEFSIENAQVINRRKEKIESSKSESKTVRSMHSDDGDETPPQKRRKINTAAGTKSPSKSKQTNSEEKQGSATKNSLGSIIGRKRKVRKMKGKSK